MLKRIRVVVAVAAVTVLAAALAAAQTAERDQIEAIVKEYLARHPQEVQRIIKDYLVGNPEVLQEALAELLKRRRSAANADKSAAIRTNAGLLFDSPRQVTLGNPKGDVTIVEFFDYNCGFCKRALADMMELMKDQNLRIVLKELPVLGAASTEAARVSIAVHLQDVQGDKYLAFHRRLLGEQGLTGKSRALAVARELGLDMDRLERDAASDEIRATLEESGQLARALGINGTPAYVVGDAVVPGSVGAERLKTMVRAARNGSP